MAVAAMQGQGQFVVRYRAQGRLNMRTKGIKPATFRWQDAASAPELQPTWLQATCRVIFARKNFFVRKWLCTYTVFKGPFEVVQATCDKVM